MNSTHTSGLQGDTPFDLLILGDGAAAALVALRALRQAGEGCRIGMVGPGVPGQGIAYATDDPAHRLNVPAGKMSALAEQPDDFVNYLTGAGLAADAPDDLLATRYVSRAWYGAYLLARLRQGIATSAASFEHLAQRAVRLSGDIGARCVVLADGKTVAASRVVLALGNALRPLPLAGADALTATQSIGAWDVPALRAIQRDGDVLVVGTGLTLVDVVLTLRGNGHHGCIHAVSRHGLLPRPHVHAAPWVVDAPALLELPLRGRVRVLRGQVAAATAAGQPWQTVFDAIRPLGVRLWTSLSSVDQRRFLRHVVRLWDVHRHRIAGEVDGVLQDALADGQLEVVSGGVGALVRQPDGRLQVMLGQGGSRTVDVLINATGLQVQVDRMDDPLIAGLLVDGLAVPGPHGLGLDVHVDAAGMACLRDGTGAVQPDLALVGSLRLGAEWETIAIPELRVQASSTVHALMAGS